MEDTRVHILGISGNFSEQELLELSSELKEKQVTVQKYQLNFAEAQEIIALAFFNFNAYTFLRDGILFEVLWSVMGKAKQWVQTKKPNAKVVPRIDLRFKTKQGVVPVNIGVPLGNKIAQEQVEKTLTIEFLDGFKDGEMINIYWDTDKNTVSVTKL